MKPSAQLSTNMPTAQLLATRELVEERGNEKQKWGGFLPLFLPFAFSRSLIDFCLLASFTTIDCCDLELTTLYLVEYIFARSRPKGPCNCIGSELPSLPFASIWVLDVKV
jgi:hypothetical protein